MSAVAKSVMVAVVNATQKRTDKRWSFSPTEADERQRAEIEAHFRAMDIEFSTPEFVAKMVRSGMRRIHNRLVKRGARNG